MPYMPSHRSSPPCGWSAQCFRSRPWRRPTILPVPSASSRPSPPERRPISRFASSPRKCPRRLNVPVVVQNQPGGGGVPAGRAVTNAPADGYTIAWVGNNTAIGVNLFQRAVRSARRYAADRRRQRIRLSVRHQRDLAIQDPGSWMKTAKQKPGTLERRHVERRHQQSSHRAAVQIGAESRLHRRALSGPGGAYRLRCCAMTSISSSMPMADYGGNRRQADPPARGDVGGAASGIAGRADDEGSRRRRLRSRHPGMALYGPKDMPQQAVDVLAQAATEIAGISRM